MRLVRGYEHTIGRRATEAEFDSVFDRWCLVSRKFWRSGYTRDDYYAEFLNAYSYARIGLDENPIDAAVARAKAAPLPDVHGFTDERIRLLAATCREMQNLMGNAPFFLPTRKLGEVFGVDHTRAAFWLRGLEFKGIIHLAPGEVRKQGGNRSPRYHYGQRLREVGAVAVTPRLTSSQPALVTNGSHHNNIAEADHSDSDKLSLCLR